MLALAERGIEVVVLKGIHLARFAYAEPALRNMADVDIMVRRDRLAEAEQVYLRHGYGPEPRPDVDEFCTRSNHLAKLVKPGVPVVEVHWSLERPTSPFQLDLDGVWERTRPAMLDGAPVRVLCPEDLLLHLAVHVSYHHHFDRAALKGLVDVQTVLARHRDELDWDALASRAVAWGMGGFVYATLRLAEELLGVNVPATALGSLPHTAEDDRAVEVARRYILLPRPELPPAYLELARSRTLRERWGHFLDNVFLPRPQMERAYSLPSGSPLLAIAYLRRIGNLLLRRSGLFLRTLAATDAMRAPLDRDDDRVRLEQWTCAADGAAHATD
ncbi:MAG: nucleotidyltransferase family protein [Gemmatimonadetes bacterium]|nr:nucleotidyltransferase family protein [Gemmatimonadota bacterium]